MERGVIDQEVRDAATRVLVACRERKLKVATAESCTGGLVAAALTEIPGSSDVFDRGFVTYSNEAKEEMLSVTRNILDRHGAVSMEAALAMATRAIANSNANVSVAITGIAGPGDGTTEKPVGLVHFAAAHISGELWHDEQRYGDAGRSAVRRSSVLHALGMLENIAIKG